MREWATVGLSALSAFVFSCGQARQTAKTTPDRSSQAASKQEATGQARVETVKGIGDADFEAGVLRSDLPVLVDFWAPWCGPCRQQGPIVERLAEVYQGRLVTVKVNVDSATRTAQEYQIRAIPTLMIFKNGKTVFNHTGLMSEAELRAEIEKQL